jgi:hypothetical protein
VNILSGPPEFQHTDAQVIADFLESDGVKVVCGSTTAEVVSRHMNVTIRVDDNFDTGFTPPLYFIDGIDLVTEGAITLNQAYNLLGEKLDTMPKNSGVVKLCLLLQAADRIYFNIGKATNTGHDNLTFRQMGILPRSTIIPLLVEKLKKAGKLVVTRNV